MLPTWRYAKVEPTLSFQGFTTMREKKMSTGSRTSYMGVFLALALIGSAGTPSGASATRTGPPETAALAPVTAQALCDRSFEGGSPNACWVEQGDETSVPPITSSNPRSGSFAVGVSPSLCSAFPCSVGAHQRFVIPNALTSAVVSGWVRGTGTSSGDPCSDAAGFLVFPESTLGTGETIGDGQIRCEPTEGVYVQVTKDITAFLQQYEGEAAVFVTGGTTQGSVGWNLDDASLTLTGEPIVHERTVTLSLRNHLVAKGTVGPTYLPAGCRHGVQVKIQKQRRDETWATLKTATTTINEVSGLGTFRKTLDDKNGIYRAKIALSESSAFEYCGAATSAVRAHSH